MTTASMPTAGEYLSQYLSDFKGAKETFNESNKNELDVALVGGRGPLPLIAGMGGMGFTMATGLLGPVTTLGAIAIVTGWWASNFSENKTLQKAGDIHQSLEENSENAVSMEGLIQGRQDILAKHRKDGEDKPKSIKQALIKSTVILGAITCGVAAGVVMAAISPLVGAGAFIGGAALFGVIAGKSHGELVGQEKITNMLDRIAESTKDFSETLGARRQNHERVAETPDPARPKNSF